VIHRDVSPQNLLLSYEGAVKISDFGLAKVRAASGRVRSETVRGKPSYMSPEQTAGDPLDGRTDLYAAGVMLWEMLADRPLFAGTAREINVQVLFRNIARPSSFRSAVPADLEAVAMTLLACDREARYPTAEAAIEALLGCADAPRDGRGELAQLLAARFPSAARARGSRRTRAASEPRAPRAEPITVAAPPSAIVAARPARPAAPRARRRVFAATLGMALLCAAFAAAVLVRGEVARSQIPERAARPVPDAAPPATPAPPGRTAPAPAPSPPARAIAAGSAQVDAGVAGAAQPAARPPGDGAPPRPAPRRDRIARPGRPGELAIIVRPWAMIWLNGKPSGQTPFRAAVPAGRYRVRLANDDAGRDEIITVTVEPDQTATVERRW
jgi:serine/threonine-protein kinase